jgi:hypothetical protein
MAKKPEPPKPITKRPDRKDREEFKARTTKLMAQ